MKKRDTNLKLLSVISIYILTAVQTFAAAQMVSRSGGDSTHLLGQSQVCQSLLKNDDFKMLCEENNFSRCVIDLYQEEKTPEALSLNEFHKKVTSSCVPQ